MKPQPREYLHLGISLSGIAALVFLLHWLRVTNATTVALGLLVIVLWTATGSRLWVAVVASVAATLSLNFFFMPPVGALTIADPQNWVALFVFLIVGFVASQLSASAQARARDAIERRRELGRLFDLSRDVLLTTEQADTLDVLATSMARRFALPRVALCLPVAGGGWQVRQGGDEDLPVPESYRDLTLRGHTRVERIGEVPVMLAPLRVGARSVGLLAVPDGRLEAGTLDAIAGLAAIAVERTELLSERKQAELMRQKADLASTLLASLSHDLRTPLTAIGVAVENLQMTQLPADQRHEQARLALAELERLKRLFRDILDMARIDAAALTVERDWVTPADIIDAAVSYLRPTLDNRILDIDADSATVVFVDPRLTSGALSHLIENAAQYSPPDRPIELRGSVERGGLCLVVRDHGQGIDASELDHVFEKFFRGRNTGRQTLGAGMGLAITRGLLSAEDGRVWGENAIGGGAQFTLTVPSPSHAAMIPQDA